jgi:hypothetical protein
MSVMLKGHELLLHLVASFSTIYWVVEGCRLIPRIFSLFAEVLSLNWRRPLQKGMEVCAVRYWYRIHCLILDHLLFFVLLIIAI